MSARSNARKEAFILAQEVKGHIWSIMIGGRNGRQLATSHLAESRGQGAMKVITPLSFSFSPFHSGQDPNPWDGTACIQDGSLSSFKYLWQDFHGQAKSWVSQVIPSRDGNEDQPSQFPKATVTDPLMAELQSHEKTTKTHGNRFFLNNLLIWLGPLIRYGLPVPPVFVWACFIVYSAFVRQFSQQMVLSM